MPLGRHSLVLKGTSLTPELSSSTLLEGNPLGLSDPKVLPVSKIAVVTASLKGPSEYV
jgi:hypothetical protein